MTKTELCGVVDRIYASWNQQINLNDQKHVYEAWWRILKDLDEATVHEVIDGLVIENGYMPRVGEVRRRSINLIQGIKIPTAIEAWQQFREAADASASGSYEGKGISEMVAKTVHALGGTRAYSLHTNGDREQFMSAYERVVKEYEAQVYALPR
jgi:hypothetical protein